MILDGEERGLAKGREKGLAQGLEQAIEQGLERVAVKMTCQGHGRTAHCRSHQPGPPLIKRNLTENGYSSSGWDPHFAPNQEKTQVDVVTLGVVR